MAQHRMLSLESNLFGSGSVLQSALPFEIDCVHTQDEIRKKLEHVFHPYDSLRLTDLEFGLDPFEALRGDNTSLLLMRCRNTVFLAVISQCNELRLHIESLQLQHPDLRLLIYSGNHEFAFLDAWLNGNEEAAKKFLMSPDDE